MATVNEQGNIVARCRYCEGAKTGFEVLDPGQTNWGGVVYKKYGDQHDFRLARCLNCGAGALAVFAYRRGDKRGLADFYPESKERLPLPEDVPKGIKREFIEGERCLEANCYRAAAAMFRSVLDKTLRANGYKNVGNLKRQIDAAADDGVITAARQKRAHEELRVLGNDVLHDEWSPMTADDVELAHRYAQRILEDFYDDRESILAVLRANARTPDEDRPGTVERDEDEGEPAQIVSSSSTFKAPPPSR
ncbi:DUF4145 domain-containing protein [Caballeronia grimmiae]|uniref:DUF4145 domain-containing protein n=1 Tax=Caballeronia grimmiae TaxID=1071679 RepID=UPI0038BA3469